MTLALLVSPLTALALMVGTAAPADFPLLASYSPTKLNVGSGFVAGAEIDGRGKRVCFTWQHLQDGGVRGQLDGIGSQIIKVSSTPLALEMMSENRALYAGKNDDGSIVYEVWEIEKPTIKLVESDEFDDFIYPELKSRKKLSGLPKNKLGQPDWCTDNRALANGVLIGFAGTPSVYGLIWDQTGSAHLTELVSTKQRPLFTAGFIHANSAKHKTLGFVYTLEAVFVTSKPGPKTLLLIDSDCDGTIDRISKPDTALLRSQGFDDESLWLERAGLSTRSGPP